MKENDHFQGKDALAHVTEKQAMGIIAESESHGTEIPGHISSGADAARETGLLIALLWILLIYLNSSQLEIVSLISIFSIGLLFWKMGRSAWLGWSRLERLHRILEQERWEIEHHRQQEREELKELYRAKGFEGKLLEDVLDVLMADNERLLHVMLKEELGLTFEKQEHPLKQSIGAALGVLLASTICFIGLFVYPLYGVLIAAALVIGISAYVSAKFEMNRPINAIVWNLALGFLSICSVYFLLNFFEKIKNHG